VKGPDGYYFALPRRRPEVDFNDDLVDVSMSAATVQITAASGNRYTYDRAIRAFFRCSKATLQKQRLLHRSSG
jgi:hypothetical protein